MSELVCFKCHQTPTCGCAEYLQSHLDALKAENEKLRTNWLPIKSRVEELEGENTSLRKELDALRARFTEMLLFVKGVQKGSENLSQACRTVMENISPFPGELDSDRKELERLSGKTGFCALCEGYAKEVQRLRKYKFVDLPPGKKALIIELLKAKKGLVQMLENRQKRMCVYREALEKICEMRLVIKGKSAWFCGDKMREVAQQALGAEGREGDRWDAMTK